VRLSSQIVRTVYLQLYLYLHSGALILEVMMEQSSSLSTLQTDANEMLYFFI